MEFLTFEDEDGRKAFRHTASHILAQAVLHLFPGVKFAIGPAIDNGFYYDFDREEAFSADDLEKIEAEMARIAKEALPIERFELPIGEARALMADQPYKLELMEEHAGKGGGHQLLSPGDFTDLCAGPPSDDHRPRQGCQADRLHRRLLAGQRKNKMLSRIYGTAFPKSGAGRLSGPIGGGEKRITAGWARSWASSPSWTRAPASLLSSQRDAAQKPADRLLAGGAYPRQVSGDRLPIILSRTLWERSGHWDHYKNNMYTTVIDDEDFAIKPMNCPGGILVYQTEMRSYRDLPLRIGELGIVHRHELSGALHGLMRVRNFTQDDAHIFMTPEQIKDEIKGVVALIDEVYSLFGFKYLVELSTRPEDSMGSDEDWEDATALKRAALDEIGLDYKVNEGTVPSTAPRSTSIWRIPSAAPGNAAPSSSISSFLNGLSWNTPAPTAASTVL